jgi:hypothetical protein
MASCGDHIARGELSSLCLAPQQCTELWIERDWAESRIRVNVDSHAAPRSNTRYRRTQVRLHRLCALSVFMAPVAM